MLFRQHVLEGIAEGRVTPAFRRWRRAPPADGSSLRSPVGVLSLDRVTVVDEGDITTEDVRRTGMSLDELRAPIAGEGTLLRIELRLTGRRSAHRAARTPAGARRARSDYREVGEDRRRVSGALDDGLPGTDRRSARHRLAQACLAGRRGGAAVQAARSTAERARSHGEPRGRLPSFATRPRSAREPRQISHMLINRTSLAQTVDAVGISPLRSILGVL